MTREERISELASDIVEAWDMDCLIGFAVDTLEENFSKLSLEDFQEEWDNFYGEEESDKE